MRNYNNTSLLTIARAVSLGSLGMAACYIILFVIYGALLTTPSGDISEKVAYLLANRILVEVSYIIGYLVFAICLIVTSVALYLVEGVHSQLLKSVTLVFGVIWAAVLFIAGMISLTSMSLMSSMDPENLSAITSIYRSMLLLENSLGGGIELIGGVWVLLLGWLSLKHGAFSRAWAVFSLCKGAIGVATVFSSEPILRDLFGLTGIVWFIWLAVEVTKWYKRER